MKQALSPALMLEYRRRLPHIHSEEVPIFLTWRLHGSAAACAKDALLKPGKAFVAEDRALDRDRQGVRWLSDTLPTITRWLKGSTAREANHIPGRTGQPFWRDESFDRWVRNSDEFGRIVRYIEYNPVSAGFVECAEDWHWSGAGQRAGESACLT